MTTTNQAPPARVTSAALSAYTLPKRVTQVLQQFDKMKAYMIKGGRALPDAISLHRADFVAIDAIVQQQSGGVQTARTVTWDGFHLRVVGDPAPALQLDGGA
ncbi:hypothetical protein [Tahibacter harae]|uniref:Uncharacterized protein n=1 Tax=Tahibacter harae TaxID=2963937 RepID=A0ABT1QS67_9GAMM|nr:hypothetical protein [Tahibacter harae]MCQ4165119.1 hypothetical protein [Tahibacter harae]